MYDLKKKATATDPENSGWYITIQNSSGVSFNASKEFYKNIQQTIKQNIDVPVLPNGHSSRRP